MSSVTTCSKAACCLLLGVLAFVTGSHGLPAAPDIFALDRTAHKANNTVVTVGTSQIPLGAFTDEAADILACIYVRCKSDGSACDKGTACVNQNVPFLGPKEWAGPHQFQTFGRGLDHKTITSNTRGSWTTPEQLDGMTKVLTQALAASIKCTKDEDYYTVWPCNANINCDKYKATVEQCTGPNFISVQAHDKHGAEMAELQYLATVQTDSGNPFDCNSILSTVKDMVGEVAGPLAAALGPVITAVCGSG